MKLHLILYYTIALVSSSLLNFWFQAISEDETLTKLHSVGAVIMNSENRAKILQLHSENSPLQNNNMSLSNCGWT